MADSSKRGRPYNRAIATAQKWATKLHTGLYRVTGGRVGGRLMGIQMMFLDTTGRRSGRTRTTPLLCLRDGADFVTVASNGGAPRDPDWWLNLQANPETTVEVDGRRHRVRAEKASPEEKARLWPRLVEMYESYEDYQKKTDREIPVVVLRPVG